jgi:eukaryotic-like serine/threonine-protein kinase
VKGKMSYLSPEAARGEEVDRRADIFAVGILLYEMLTGKRLFYGESDYQTVELVRAARIPPIGTQNPEVESELEEIVRKSLARRPDDRFQSATDLQDALAQYLFSRGLKMIQRDIAELVRGCLEDQAAASGAARRSKTNIIDTLLQDEIQSFTSVDFQDGQENDGQGGLQDRDAQSAGLGQEAGTRPPHAGRENQGGGRRQEGGGVAPLPSSHSGEYVDTRAWAQDADWGGRRLTPPAMTPPPTSRAAGASGDPGSEPVNRPTPQSAEIDDLLESPAASRRFSKGLIIGVLVGALVIGVAFAAWLVGG